tara:strand:+ start:2784 stop:2903 length:120 start_codon:yes stop_codon:yes gene_type:complete
MNLRYYVGSSEDVPTRFEKYLQDHKGFTGKKFKAALYNQ